jgi:hypothetical protein
VNSLDEYNLNENDINLNNLKSNNDRNMIKSRKFLSTNQLDLYCVKEIPHYLSKKQVPIRNEIFHLQEKEKFGDIIKNNECKDKEKAHDLNKNININNNFTYNKNKNNNASQNSSHIFLKDNKNENKLISKNNSFGGLYKNLEINLRKDKRNSIYNLNIIDYSRSSKERINQHKNSTEISDVKLRSIKIFSFFDFLKSIMFKRTKGNHYFISIFRKHLLSEEHLLKSHIKMVFLERKHNLSGEENTNIVECFNEL